MNKITNLAVSTLIVVLGLMCSAVIFIATAQKAPRKTTQYAVVMEVVELDESEDLVILADMNGNAWEWEGIEDWEVGDICGVLMDDNGTAEIYDDIIENIRYCGRVSE